MPISLDELTFIQEHYKQEWAKEIKDLLLEIKAQVDLARTQGKAALPRVMRQAYEERYLRLVEQGIAANPPPPRKKGTRGPLRGDDVRNRLASLAGLSSADPAIYASVHRAFR